ncbi:MAG: hypothetical protein A2Z74_01990 [Chloroflexi bacterium RBG_13_46_9]|nr:MAG: hypothetical protein A2Z74_01990 [Chloroflexi bacterium RBG_13_46_9]
MIAKSFARIFFRNSIDIGLPLLESEDAPGGIKSGDVLEVDLEKGILKNITTGKQYHSKPYPEFMSELVKAGGLIEYTKRRLIVKK